MAIELLQYQTKGVQYLLQNNRALLWDQQGLGKTVQVLCAIEHLKPKIVIVICPAVVTGVWEDEIYKFNIKRKPQVLSSSKTKLNSSTNFIIISYGLIKKKLPLLLKIIKRYETLVVCDESHYIKNTSAQRTQETYKVLSRATYGWQLTGTPSDKTALDFYLPMKFILGKKCLSRLEFARTFCNKEYDYNTGDVVFTGYKDSYALNRYLKGHYIRRTVKKVQKQLPDKIIQDVFVRIKSPKDYMYASPKEGRGVNARRYKKLGIAKVKFVVDFVLNLMEGNDEQIIVFAQHKRVIALLAKKLKKFKPSIIMGETPKTRRNEIRKKFQAGKVRILIANAEAASVGITLHSGRMVVFAELPHKGTTYNQAMDRVYRIGQLRNCMIYKIIARQTLDVNINKMLSYKTKNSSEAIS
jgi:SWI/SNF-related matrix-associated actin-dependent regulator 1 of chromatin subfamily A